MNETVMLSSFLCLRFSCPLSSREAPALRPIAHSIKKRFRAQNKSSMRSDGAGAGTPSLRGVGRSEAEAERVPSRRGSIDSGLSLVKSSSKG